MTNRNQRLVVVMTNRVNPPRNLTYSSNPAAYSEDDAITTNSPTSTGGPITSYSVSPSLPTGLSLNPTTGAITGTPTTATAQATYVVTAIGPGGSTTCNVLITITPDPVSLVKTGGTDGWNAGAFSDADSIASGNGYVEFMINALDASTRNYLCGLSNDNPNGDRLVCDFGIQIAETSSGGGSQAYVIENGTLLNGGTPDLTAFVENDVFRVEVSGSNILYKKNGVTFRTTTPTITYPLKPAACLHSGTTTPKATVKAAMFSSGGATAYGVTWANLLAATTA